jgi:hypothetical protein
VGQGLLIIEASFLVGQGLLIIEASLLVGQGLLIIEASLLVDQGLLIIEDSRLHLDTPQSVGLLRRTENTQHSQETDIHSPGGIRTRNPSKRAATAISNDKFIPYILQVSFTLFGRVFWGATSCSLVGRYQRYGEICSFHFKDRSE